MEVIKKVDLGQEHLEKYLKEGKDRIYDMLSMLDLYGNKRKAEEAKKLYMEKFPESELTKNLEEQSKKTGRKQHQSIFGDSTKDKSLGKNGTISE